MNATSQSGRARNPNRQDEYNSTRARKEREAGPGYSENDVNRIRRKLGDRCAYCNVALHGKGVIDHIIPIRYGGAHSADNIAIACSKCNGDKHSKTAEEFIEWRKRAGLPVRKGIDWKKFQLPVTDDGLIELLATVFAPTNKADHRLHIRIKAQLRAFKPALIRLLNQLESVERAVIEMRFGVNRPRVTTQWLIGDKLGLSQGSISGLQKSALSHIREMANTSRIILR